MTRGRRLLYVLLGICALGLAAATGASLTISARAAVGPLPPEGLALPAESTFVMGLDVRRFVASPFYTRYLARDLKARPDAFRDLEERTGLNPERDVDRILVSGSGERNQAGAAIVFGRFDRSRVQQAIESAAKGRVTWKGHQGATVYIFGEGSRRPGALAFLADGVLVMGSQSMVETVASNHASGGKGLTANVSLMKLLESVAAGSTFWVVGDQSVLSNLDRGFRVRRPAGHGLSPAALTTEAAATPPPPGLGPNPLAGLPPLKSIVVTGDLDPIVSFQATGETADEAAARNLADVIRGFVALAQLQAAQKPELKELTTAVSITQEAQRVVVNGRFPYELLDSLQPRKLAPAARPVAGSQTR